MLLERNATDSGGDRDNDTACTPRLPFDPCRTEISPESACLNQISRSPLAGPRIRRGRLTGRGSFPAAALHADSREDHWREITHGAYTGDWILAKMCGKCCFCSWKAEAHVKSTGIMKAKWWHKSALGSCDEWGWQLIVAVDVKLSRANTRQDEAPRAQRLLRQLPGRHIAFSSVADPQDLLYKCFASATQTPSSRFLCLLSHYRSLDVDVIWKWL